MAQDRPAGNESLPRGSDWEVVNLTASTYAAAPGGKPYDETDGKEYTIKGNESSSPVFMSCHFAASQSEIESFLKDPNLKGQKEPDIQGIGSDDRKGDEFDEKIEQIARTKLHDDLHSITAFDEGKGLSLVDMDFGDSKSLEALEFGGEGLAIFSSSSESLIGRFTAEQQTDLRSQLKTVGMDASKGFAVNEEGGNDGAEPWWKKQIVSLYKHAKESNKFWSVFVAAAALLGIAYFGRRWHQRGKLQLQQIKFQTSCPREKANHVVESLSHIKDVFISNNQRGTTSPHSQSAFG